MLLGVDTGYEGSFDFPRRTASPERTYLIATVPRTGSTWFSHLLWQTGCLGAPLEYLNFDPGGPPSGSRDRAGGSDGIDSPAGEGCRGLQPPMSMT